MSCPWGLPLVVDVSVKTECFRDMNGVGNLSRKQTVSKTHRRVELPMGLAARFELPVGLAARFWCAVCCRHVELPLELAAHHEGR